MQWSPPSLSGGDFGTFSVEPPSFSRNPLELDSTLAHHSTLALNSQTSCANVRLPGFPVSPTYAEIVYRMVLSTGYALDSFLEVRVRLYMSYVGDDTFDLPTAKTPEFFIKEASKLAEMPVAAAGFVRQYVHGHTARPVKVILEVHGRNRRPPGRWIDVRESAPKPKGFKGTWWELKGNKKLRVLLEIGKTAWVTRQLACIANDVPKSSVCWVSNLEKHSSVYDGKRSGISSVTMTGQLKLSVRKYSFDFVGWLWRITWYHKNRSSNAAQLCELASNERDWTIHKRKIIGTLPRYL